MEDFYPEILLQNMWGSHPELSIAQMVSSPSGRYFEYLLKEMKTAKKSMGEWNTLIKLAISEVDAYIISGQISSSVEKISFDDYQKKTREIGEKMRRNGRILR